MTEAEEKGMVLEVADWLWGTVQGSFNEQQTTSQIIVDAVSSGMLATKPLELRHLNGRLKSIAGGGYHSCGLTVAGGVVCWGSGFTLGAGEPPETSRFDPKPVMTVNRVELSGVQSLCSAYEFNCALREDGVWCWGDNGTGELGIGNRESSAVAVQTLPARDLTRIDCGITAAGAIRQSTGETFVWGGEILGMGLGGLTPVRVPDPSIQRLGIGDRIQCFLDPAGGVRCRESPTDNYQQWRVVLSNTRSDMATGTSQVCAIMSNGTVTCWSSRTGAVEQAGLREPKRIASESYAGHFCAIAQDGSLLCWGNNGFGQLGTGSSDDQADKPPTPVRWR